MVETQTRRGWILAVSIGAHGLLAGCVVGEDAPGPGDGDVPYLAEAGTYCAVPVIRGLRIRDDHENAVGGHTSYFYFEEAGNAKSGDLFPQVGDERFDTNAWASNLQGNLAVAGGRAQWEFYAGDGFDQYTHGWSSRAYPVVYRNCVSARSGLGWRYQHVKEDDEWGLNDHVGYVVFDTGRCNGEVFDRGQVEGWTGEVLTIGTSDIAEVVYRLWCYAADAGGDLIADPAPPPPAGYLGCFTDGESRALPYVFGEGYTVDSCREAARDAGLPYFGVQWYGWCFGGHAPAYDRVDDAECNTPCNANPAQTCGGGWRNSVYASW